MNDKATTALGVLQGLPGDGVVSFRNVPYAAPPIGDLRFKAPAPAKPWKGVRDARTHGPSAPQPASRLRAAMGDFARPQDEDCLTLTIATPSADDARRPVIVWLHGGAYLSGGGSLDWYDGSVLARDGDVVVVGVNYRLGALGFLHHPNVGDTNCALLDMIAALGWVRDNIAAFGGDPGRVTVMGQSAGAHAIMCLLTMPAARGLFHRAILQSTPPAMVPLAPATATEYAERLLVDLGIPADAAGMPQRLRAAPPERLVAAQMAVARAIARFADVSPPFVPVFEDFADPKAFIAAAAASAGAQKIDLVIGTTREEMHAFFAADPAMANPDPQAVAARFEALAGSAGAIEAYRMRRPAGSTTDLLGDLVTDHMFLFPSLALADAAIAAGARAWVYQFDWAAPGNKFKSCHCLELPFAFGTDAWAGAGMLDGSDAGEVAGLSRLMRAAWTAFAHSGDPAALPLPWPAYDVERRMTMIFGSISGPLGDPAGAMWRDGFDAWRVT